MKNYSHRIVQREFAIEDIRHEIMTGVWSKPYVIYYVGCAAEIFLSHR